MLSGHHAFAGTRIVWIPANAPRRQPADSAHAVHRAANGPRPRTTLVSNDRQRARDVAGRQ